uniref:Rab-GAP TBC domain-containing protein n=1 Tax=Strigamia maritima TaxID=126957 RepID=T1IW08_STRMM
MDKALMPKVSQNRLHKVMKLVHSGPPFPASEWFTPLKVDPYGFELSDDFDYDSYEEFMAKYLSVLARRAKKWQYLLDHTNTVKKSGKVKRYVRKGIPSEHRGLMWATVSGVLELRDQNPDTYTKALSVKKNEELINAISIGTIMVIIMDFLNSKLIYVFRHSKNLPRQCIFQKMDEGHLGSLFNVLVAFAHYHTEIGYCQGLNYIAGLLLLVVKDEEITFWLLTKLVSDIVPNYYTKKMDGLLQDIEVLSQLVSIKMPQIAAHIEKVDVTWPLIVTKWFVCLYAEVLPIETILRIWDCLFYEGNKILFRVALTLLKIHQDKILAAPDMPRVLEVFKQIVRDSDVLNCHEFMEGIFKEPGSLSREQIHKLRASGNPQKTNYA